MVTRSFLPFAFHVKRDAKSIIKGMPFSLVERKEKELYLSV